MSIIARYLERRHLMASLILLAAFAGLIGFIKIPYNLFPDMERPQMAVVTVFPGASAADVAADVSRVIEKELSTIENVKRVISVNKDEVSTVTVEFGYTKSLDQAATDVANGLQKIRPSLPPAIQPSMLFKISSASQPVLTLAMQPREGSPLDLMMVRQLADNAIKERLLRIPEIAGVEVFGAHQPIVRIDLHRDALERYRLTPLDVRKALVATTPTSRSGSLSTRTARF